jgi:hypothetical protein
MKRVLVLCPTAWDRKQLEACRAAWSERVEVELWGPTDEERAWDFDVLGFIDQTVERFGGRIEGVMSTSDYPGATAAAAVATRLGLCGSLPEVVIRSSHKYYSRVAQREAAPEATPRFALVDPLKPEAAIGFPTFVKPVKGAFSIMAGRVDSQEELESFVSRPAAREFIGNYMHAFNQLADRLAHLEVNGSWFLAEELLHGCQVTVDGFAAAGEVVVLGIVDSDMHPTTRSFERFDYPSALDPSLRERMGDLVRRVIARLGLDDSLFNVELAYEEKTDRVSIIEVNPRMSGQFADLYAKVDGFSLYEVALALAVGERPRVLRRAGADRAASSFPLRIYEPVRVERAPGEAEIMEVESRFPGTLVWPECQTGGELSDFERFEDGKSARYAVVNVGAESRDAVIRRCAEVRAALDFRFAPVR